LDKQQKKPVDFKGYRERLKYSEILRMVNITCPGDYRQVKIALYGNYSAWKTSYIFFVWYY